MEFISRAFLVFFIANIVLVVWALVDAIRVPDDSMYRAGKKLIWVLVVLFAGFVGAIIYLFVGKPASGRLEAGRVTAGSASAPPARLHRLTDGSPSRRLEGPLYDGITQSGARPGPEPTISDTILSRSSAEPNSITT